MHKKTGIRTAELQEIVERYIDCPYCNVIISDNATESAETVTVEDFPCIGRTIKCPACSKTIRIR